MKKRDRLIVSFQSVGNTGEEKKIAPKFFTRYRNGRNVSHPACHILDVVLLDNGDDPTGVWWNARDIDSGDMVVVSTAWKQDAATLEEAVAAARQRYDNDTLYEIVPTVVMEVS